MDYVQSFQLNFSIIICCSLLFVHIFSFFTAIQETTMEGYSKNHYSLLHRNSFSFKTIQEFSLAMMQNHRLIWKLINKMCCSTIKSGVMVVEQWGSAKDDFDLGIYDCRDLWFGKGVGTHERVGKIFFNWLRRWGFWSFKFVSLK